MRKELATTTDVLDDLLCAGRWISQKNLDEVMAYCAGIGATRHQWVIGLCQLPFYETPTPGGFDLLGEACESAHRHGMRFDVIFKPFEGGYYQAALPLTFPRPAGLPLLSGRHGLIYNVSSFAARHPDMQHARHPRALADPGGPITQVRFVKQGTEPVNIRAEDFTIAYSDTVTGERIRPYRGPMTLRDTVEYRPIAPYGDRSCRVLTLGGLELPRNAEVFIVWCHARIAPGGFQNRDDSLVELVNDAGCVIPSELALPVIKPKAIERARTWVRLGGIHPYLELPEVRTLIENHAVFTRHIRTMNRVRCNDVVSQPLGRGIGNGSRIVIFRGKERFHPGVLNPVYPEVRAHWLDAIRFFMDRGVDGVNVRIGNHSIPFEPREFGFNAPTLAQMQQDDNHAEAARLNGRGYTQFLRDAADLLHSAGKELGVHIRSSFFYLGENRMGPRFQCTPLPGNIEWKWREWIRDIVDYVEFRGAWTLNPVSLKDVVDRIGLAAREAGKTFIYQSSRSNDVVSFKGPHAHLAWELDLVARHPDVHVYNLYETAGLTKMDAPGRIVGSPDIAALVRRRSFFLEA